MIEVLEPIQHAYQMEVITIESFQGNAYFTHYETENGEPKNPKVIDPMELISRLRQQSQLQVIDSRIVYSDSDLLVWHFTPPAGTPLYLKSNGQSLALKIKWPNLLFARKGKALFVAVLQHKTRPTNKTRLYLAPLPNVYANHNICLGSVSLPDNNDIDEISMAYIESTKTHLSNSDFWRKGGLTIERYVQWIKQKADSKTTISVSELKYSGTVSEFIQKLGGK